MAGTDTTLLALAGTGFSRGYGGSDAFGFMSCERAVGAAEGMNVLAERKKWVEEEQQLPAGTTAKKGARGAELGAVREQQVVALPPCPGAGQGMHLVLPRAATAGRTPPWVRQY